MRDMALVAEEGWPHFEHGIGGRTMWIMAIHAVLGDRLVAMYEWAAFFHVAGVTSVVDAVAFQQFRADRTVRIMAVGTGHLALRNWMVRRAVYLGALLLVAGKADFSLGFLVTHFVVFRVNLVAGCARQIAALMRAAFPV